MAITENGFTEAELGAALDANPELLSTVRATAAARKYVLRTEAEETEFKTNLEASVASRKTSEFAQGIEKDVLDATGVAKLNADEKYFDYLKRAFTESTKSIKDEIAELKAKPGATTEADKLLITNLQKQLADNKTEYDSKLQEKDGELTKLQGNHAIQAELGKMKFKATLPPEVVQVLQSNAIAELLPQLRFGEGGVIELVGADGQKVMNSTTYKPVTLEEALKTKLAAAIEIGKKQEGAGGNGGAGGAGGSDDNLPKEFTGVPPEVTTKFELGEYLKKIGIVTSSPEYDKILSEHGKNLKLR